MTYIVEFKDDVTQEQIDAWLLSNTSKNDKLTTGHIYKVEANRQPATDDIVARVLIDANISSQLLNTVEVLPASTGETRTFNHDAEWWKTACANYVNFDNADTSYQKRGKKTTVYMVDSGVKVNHPDLVDCDIEQLFAFNSDPSDHSGHGTALASLVIGSTLGISNAKLKSVKIFDPNTTTLVSDIVRAFDAIVVDILAHPESIAILNLSWSIPKNDYVESRIQELLNAGAYVVAAAGNSGIPIENVTPASMDAVLTVGAYTDELQPADFSNYTSDIQNTQGSTNYGALDIWAPGANINTALLDDTVGSISGTSAAAAIMTACLAYNSEFLYNDMGFTADYKAALDTYTMLRTNLLTFTDAKYANSVNRIATVFTSQPVGIDTGVYSANYVVYGNSDIHAFLTYSGYANRIELDSPLPDGLSLSNGWIVGRLTNPPVDSSVTHSYTVKVTFNNGNVNTFQLTLHEAKADTPPNDTPADITLLVCSGTTCGSCGIGQSNLCFSCGIKNGGCLCAAQNPC